MNLGSVHSCVACSPGTCVRLYGIRIREIAGRVYRESLNMKSDGLGLTFFNGGRTGSLRRRRVLRTYPPDMILWERVVTNT